MEDTPLLEKSGMRKGRSLDGQVKKGKVLKVDFGSQRSHFARLI